MDFLETFHINLVFVNEGLRFDHLAPFQFDEVRTQVEHSIAGTH